MTSQASAYSCAERLVRARYSVSILELVRACMVTGRVGGRAMMNRLGAAGNACVSAASSRGYCRSVEQMARGEMACLSRLQFRLLDATAVEGVGAAGVKA